MNTFSIRVDRHGLALGTLHYRGSFTFSCDCWWDPADQIPKGIYSGCSATHMATTLNSRKQPREGIFIPNVPGRTGIFIHYWPGPGADLRAWSDGCAVVREPDMLKIWNDIDPKNGRNVTVTVEGSLPTPQTPAPPGGVSMPYPNALSR